MEARWIVRLCATLALAAPSMAHDFWMEPSTFRPETGRVVRLRLFVGDGFPGDPRPRDPRHFTRFELLGPSGSSPIEGRAGRDPAGFARLERPGSHVAVYESRATELELDPAAFDRYLEEVGLDAVAASRADGGASPGPVREAYSRCAKTLLRSGDDPTGFDRVARLTLELIPERDPASLDPGEPLVLRVEYRGRPVEGILLRAFRRGAKGARLEARTDATGRASLRLDAPGIWLFSAVHMVRSRAGAHAEWESFWSSLTVEVPPWKRPREGAP